MPCEHGSRLNTPVHGAWQPGTGWLVLCCFDRARGAGVGGQ
ncbi:MAG: hypothetical protein PHF57_00700 [Methanoregula sp.]|nr:hypothetical protein [Methanoregula sp.]